MANYISCLTIKENGDIFAGADVINGFGGVFRSTDNGESWEEINQGVITTDVRALAIKGNGDIFAGTYPSSGVYRSTDNGESWSDISTGLIPVGGNVWSVAIDANGFALSGTAGGGVFRSVQSTTAQPCPQSRRYWKDHPELWPLDTLVLGSQSYDKTELEKIIGGDGRNGDASLVVAGQLIAAKLNLAHGSDPAPVSGTIDNADAILSGFSAKLPYAVKRSSLPGRAMAADVGPLRDYNLGKLTPGCSP